MVYGGEKVKRLVIEMEDNFHREVKIRAASRDSSMKDYIKQLIEKDLQTKKEQTQ